MSYDGWWIFEAEGRAITRERLAQAERDRLAREVAGSARPFRAVVAGLLRGIAARLDGGPRSSAERLVAVR